MARLLILCRHPYHLHRDEAQAWLRQELEAVLRSDDLHYAKLTRLVAMSSQTVRTFDWLLEVRLEAGAGQKTMDGSAMGGLVADLRLLGMQPTVVVAEDGDAVELGRP